MGQPVPHRANNRDMTLSRTAIRFSLAIPAGRRAGPTCSPGTTYVLPNDSEQNQIENRRQKFPTQQSKENRSTKNLEHDILVGTIPRLAARKPIRVTDKFHTWRSACIRLSRRVARQAFCLCYARMKLRHLLASRAAKERKHIAQSPRTEQSLINPAKPSDWVVDLCCWSKTELTCEGPFGNVGAGVAPYGVTG